MMHKYDFQAGQTENYYYYYAEVLRREKVVEEI